ncbi:methyltransferase dimerization domain-containing protein [Maridesulfovibrio ferrireducens]|uniref:methyltransferase family protein n=1 Tax=Maridesulfovibrio ferrireducens TaxID=246191 RepID=UPI001A1FBAB6|nr:methyltransferase dimerization domain-containing protein [Maridesulfovibrio ferrireducens]MBI9113100.1 methyltransferase domain-containing protein [Maridesulfovibrio ferrireducens]
MSTPIPILRDLCVPETASSLEDILNGFRAHQVLKAACELGVFELLSKGQSFEREEIVKRVGINGMFIRSFLLSLMEIGLINEKDEKYSNSDMAETFLVQSSPLYQGGWIEQDTGKDSRWNDLTEHLKKDKPESYAFDQAPKTDFIKALGQRSLRGELQGVAHEVVSWDKFSEARNVLDLGGGHGLYAIALCQVNTDLQGVIFDKPHVIPETNVFIENYEMSNRLRAQGGDIDTDDIGEGYDIVLASHVLYKFRKNMPEFFRKIRQALKPNGLLVLNHWFCSPGCIPTDGLLEMDKAFLSFGHPLCYIEKFNGLLKDCGFRVISTKDIPGTFGTSNLHLALKTEAVPDFLQPESVPCCSPR